MSSRTASQIAAQAAMHVQNTKHDPRRSQTVDPFPLPGKTAGPRKPSYPPPIQTTQSSSGSSISQSRTNSAGPESAATTAANVVFPRSPLASPHLLQYSDSRPQSPVVDRDAKQGKEKSSRRKLFSKPNKIMISKDRDLDRKTIQTAGIYGPGSRPTFNHSTTSLADSIPSLPSLYSNVNASTSTLVPSDRGLEKEKDKHRHHFLSRQKNKLKDEHHNLPLSSASSNSRPADPNAPQSLYSFAPSSPGVGNKSISGLDLRHGGRALREKKKKEEKAAQTSSFVPPIPAAPKISLDDPSDVNVIFGAGSTTSVLPHPSDIGTATQGLTGFGLQNMGVDDAWPLLKARLLNIFEGEDIRTPVEDFNRLVNVHLQRCIARRRPGAMVEDVKELLRTGFLSLDHTLWHVPDERIVPHLVETWIFVFCTVLPFMQAAFLPLDLEFKGHGTLLQHPTEATDFWGAVAASTGKTTTTSGSSDAKAGTAPGANTGARAPLDIRTLVLHTFRSTIILPRHDTLLAIFSRLSLDSINVLPSSAEFPSPPSLQPRPGTAASSSLGSSGLALDPGSFNSQGSTLLDSSTAGSLGARSRATSNTSAGSFPSIGGRSRAGTSAAAPPGPSQAGVGIGIGGMGPVAMDSAQVTETAARMLQCVSVLARLGGVGDDEEVGRGERVKMEGLAKELKLNWLGRSRTGRRRQGFVGSRVRGAGVVGGVRGGAGLGGVPVVVGV